ncbi:Rho Guanine Nucleotide Exchange Factor 6 [Manis pentadactyla]|nr:Rho Guanine Nucleotide Exchange Factor 6 [Manis pentadactyla]
MQTSSRCTVPPLRTEKTVECVSYPDVFRHLLQASAVLVPSTRKSRLLEPTNPSGIVPAHSEPLRFQAMLLLCLKNDGRWQPQPLWAQLQSRPQDRREGCRWSPAGRTGPVGGVTSTSAFTRPRMAAEMAKRGAWQLSALGGTTELLSPGTIFTEEV